jgi:heme A synthase
VGITQGQRDTVKHAVFLLFMVCLQGAFGAWTVTMKLFPPVVTGHLLLGFATFTTLVLLVARLSPFLKASGNKSRCLFTAVYAVSERGTGIADCLGRLDSL